MCNFQWGLLTVLILCVSGSISRLNVNYISFTQCVYEKCAIKVSPFLRKWSSACPSACLQNIVSVNPLNTVFYLVLGKQSELKCSQLYQNLAPTPKEGLLFDFLGPCHPTAVNFYVRGWCVCSEWQESDTAMVGSSSQSAVVGGGVFFFT